jgi:HEAT repeat protein
VALAKIQDPRAVKYLIDLARQRDKERRMIAVKTLQKFDTPEAIEAVEKFSRRL